MSQQLSKSLSTTERIIKRRIHSKNLDAEVPIELNVTICAFFAVTGDLHLHV